MHFLPPASLFLLISSSLIVNAFSPPVIDLGYATYQGVFNATSNTTNFFGIRFAAPPVGKLRFQAPSPPLQVSGIQMADTQPPACPSAASGTNNTTPFRGLSKRQVTQTEDCLFLNVFVSGSINPDAKMPVLFFIHGGGYVDGSAHGAIIGDDPIIEAGGGIISVEAEYRLGIFGFLAGKEIKQKGALNNGLLDQNFALEWIQKYIHLFGGDPNRVTIWGQSAGAGSVLQHLVAHGGNTQPQLFHAAMTSSTFLPSQYRFDDPVPEIIFSQLVQMAGCSDAEDAFECLVVADTSALETANVAISSEGLFGTFVTVPVVDGEFITERPTQTISRGKLNGDVLLSVTNTFEGRDFVSQNFTANKSITDYISQLMPQFSEQQIKETTKIYTNIGLDTVFEQATAIIGESIFICPTYSILGAFPGRSYKGEFAIPPGNHADDAPYYFPGNSVPPFNNPQFRASFSGAFMSIVRSANPNVHPPVPDVITPHWNTFNVGHTEMLFNKSEGNQPVITPITTDRKLLQRCDFWRSIAASIPQ